MNLQKKNCVFQYICHILYNIYVFMKVRTCVRPCMRTRGHWAPNMYETQRPHVAFALPPVPLWPTPWIPSAHFVPSKPISLCSFVNLYHTALPIFSLAQFFTYPRFVEWQVFFLSLMKWRKKHSPSIKPHELSWPSNPLSSSKSTQFFSQQQKGC